MTQNPGTFLLGSPSDVESLSARESASVLVVSDSHGASGVLSSIVSAFGSACDAMVFCGDGMQDLACVLRSFLASGLPPVPPVVGFVEGNCDTDSYGVPPLELSVPLTGRICVCSRSIFFTHGHRFSLYDGSSALEQAAEESGCDIALFGHTHVPCLVQRRNVLLLNPGSCFKPRGGFPPSFAVLGLRKGSVAPKCTFFGITQDGAGFKPFSPPSSL